MCICAAVCAFSSSKLCMSEVLPSRLYCGVVCIQKGRQTARFNRLFFILLSTFTAKDSCDVDQVVEVGDFLKSVHRMAYLFCIVSEAAAAQEYICFFSLSNV